MSSILAVGAAGVIEHLIFDLARTMVDTDVAAFGDLRFKPRFEVVWHCNRAVSASSREG